MSEQLNKMGRSHSGYAQVILETLVEENKMSVNKSSTFRYKMFEYLVNDGVFQRTADNPKSSEYSLTTFGLQIGRKLKKEQHW